MTDSTAPPRSMAHDPLHPASRLGRVLQQLRSFGTMHAAELDGVASELEAAGQAELAARLRVYRDLHAQEAGLILDELADVRAELERAAATDDPVSAALPGPPFPIEPSDQSEPAGWVDPAAKSPKRARWLAEQARQAAEQAQRPRSRREFFQRPNG